MNKPTSLYHYTNIDSLALILKNRTIRLNGLDKMDDLQEKTSMDHKNIGRYFYASSWTDDSRESIPMWNMYTRMDGGVRISLPTNPFVKYKLSKETLSPTLPPSMRVEGDGTEHWIFFPPEYIVDNKISSPQLMHDDILYKMEYTDDKNLLYPRIITRSDNHINLNYENIGKYKNIHWEFQREWRYLMMLIPINIFENPEKALQDVTKLGNDIANQTDNDPLPLHVDLKINEESFSKMIITKSPKLSHGNEVILEGLMEKFNSFGMVNESSLRGLI